MTRVGVALSGGGHRASVWAAGLLLYLADAGRNGDVGVIASVSGGSITNGQRMKPLSSTIDLQPGVSHVEVAAPAFGDAPFTVVSNE